MQEIRMANVTITQFAIIETPKSRTHPALEKLAMKTQIDLVDVTSVYIIRLIEFFYDYVIIISTTMLIRLKKKQFFLR